MATNKTAVSNKINKISFLLHVLRTNCRNSEHPVEYIVSWEPCITRNWPCLTLFDLVFQWFTYTYCLWFWFSMLHTSSRIYSSCRANIMYSLLFFSNFIISHFCLPFLNCIPTSLLFFTSYSTSLYIFFLIHCSLLVSHLCFLPFYNSSYFSVYLSFLLHTLLFFMVLQFTSSHLILSVSYFLLSFFL